MLCLASASCEAEDIWTPRVDVLRVSVETLSDPPSLVLPNTEVASYRQVPSELMSPSVELISPIKISAFLSPSAEPAEDASTKATLRPMRLARARAASTAYPVSSPSAPCMACGASEVSRATVRVPGVTRASSDTAGVTVSYSIWSIVGVVNVDSGLNAHPLRPKTAMTAAVPAPNRAACIKLPLTMSTTLPSVSYTIRALRGISGCSHQLTWYLTPHLRTGVFAREAAATFTTDPLAREAVLPQRK